MTPEPLTWFIVVVFEEYHASTAGSKFTWYHSRFCINEAKRSLAWFLHSSPTNCTGSSFLVTLKLNTNKQTLKGPDGMCADPKWKMPSSAPKNVSTTCQRFNRSSVSLASGLPSTLRCLACSAACRSFANRAASVVLMAGTPCSRLRITLTTSAHRTDTDITWSKLFKLHHKLEGTLN